MKQVLVILSLVAAVSAYSQGTVNFQNKAIPVPSPGPAGTILTYNARISYGAGVGGAVAPITVGSNIAGNVSIAANGLTYGINARAALYGGAVGATEGQMVLLIPAVGFRSGANAGYVLVGSDPSRSIDTVGPAANAWVQVRAWDTGDTANTYEDAALKVGANHGVYLGKSEILQVTLGGGSPPLAPADLYDNRTQTLNGDGTINTPGTPLQPLALGYFVPEPSIIGLGILGALAGLFVFRRRN
jgi:hypothetical protein